MYLKKDKLFSRGEISNHSVNIFFCLQLKLVVAGAFYPNYFQTAEIEEKEASKQMSGQNPFTCVVVSLFSFPQIFLSNLKNYEDSCLIWNYKKSFIVVYNYHQQKKY